MGKEGKERRKIFCWCCHLTLWTVNKVERVQKTLCSLLLRTVWQCNWCCSQSFSACVNRRAHGDSKGSHQHGSGTWNCGEWRLPDKTSWITRTQVRFLPNRYLNKIVFVELPSSSGGSGKGSGWCLVWQCLGGGRKEYKKKVVTVQFCFPSYVCVWKVNLLD